MKTIAAASLILTLVLSNPLSSEEHSAGVNQEKPVDECSRELLLAYFPEPFVKETLKKFQIPENQWDAIVQALAAKDKEVVQTVEKKAADMDPNPLKDPQSRQEAVKLFRDTLLQVFGDVLATHGINDPDQVKSMLDDVQKQKALRFAKCMQKSELKIAPVKTPPSDDKSAND